MTDISNWYEFIERVTKTVKDSSWNNKGVVEETHIVVPLNDYQIGNLLGLLKWARSAKKQIPRFGGGDWEDEIRSILICAVKKLDMKNICSNFGDNFDTESWKKGGWGLHNKGEEKSLGM